MVGYLYYWLGYDGKYYVGNDGNHRINLLRLQYLNEASKATSLEELLKIREKYTINIQTVE